MRFVDGCSVSTTVLPSGLLDNSVTVELVGVTMKGYRVASYLIFTLLPCFATAGLLYIPIKDTKRHGMAPGLINFVSITKFRRVSRLGTRKRENRSYYPRTVCFWHRNGYYSYRC